MSKKGQGEKRPATPPVPAVPGGPPVPAVPAVPGGPRVPTPQSRPVPVLHNRPLVITAPSGPPIPTPQSRPVPILQHRPLAITPPSGPPVPPSAGGQRMPPPPRKPRTSVPTTGIPGELSSVAPPPMVVKRGAEPPSTSTSRPATPSLLSPVATTPRKMIDPGSLISGSGAPDAGPLSSLRGSIPDAGPMPISSQVTPPRKIIGPGSSVPGTSALDSGRLYSRRASMPDPVPKPMTSQATQPTSDSTRASGTKTAAQRVTILESHGESGPPDFPVDPVSSVPTKTGSVSKPPPPIKASDTLESLQSTIQDTRPSTSAQGTQSSPRASKAMITTGDKTPSPRGSVKGERPSTSGEGTKMKDPKSKGLKGMLQKSLFGKKTTETGADSSRSNQQPRRTSIGAAANKAKTTRILYTTDEEVRDALIEFTVFIIFLILTSLVTLSVRHSYMFYFNDTIKKLFTSRDLVIAPSVTVNFEKQITVPDWWDYLVYNFLITLHGDLTIMDDGPKKNTTDTGQGNSLPEAPSDDYRKNPENEFADGEPLEDTIEKRARSNPGVNPRQHKQLPVSPLKTSQRKKTQSKYNTSEHHLEGRVFLYENLLLGPPRIRQIRVRKESCYVNDAFIRYFNSCYAAYSRSAEDKSDFQGISYQTMSSLDTMPLWTVLAFYRTGGYVVDLTYEKDENLAIITDLKNNHWIDRGSRLCLVEFNLFNDNTDIFQSVKLIAEIPPTGGVIPQAHLQTVKQHSFFTDHSMAMSVVYIFWYIMVLYYTIYEVNEVRKSGCKNYIFSIMNMLDCIILLLCYLALGYNIWHSLKIISVTNKATVENTYQSLDVLCFWNIIYVDMMAILAFLVWIKIFKFISFNKTLVQFTTTLKRCSKDLAGFSLMFGIVFLAYAQLGLLLFGTKHPDFRNFITSILTMIRMILGDFQYNLIEQANRVLGPIYFLTYILLVFFILLNMFLAIIMETYNTVKGEITQGRSQLGSYIYKKTLSVLYWLIHCGRKRRASRESAAETEEEAKVTEEEPEVMQNLTATEARYFQEIPPGENKELVRLTNRVSLLEEILEKLVTNMDGILKRVEQERAHRKK